MKGYNKGITFKQAETFSVALKELRKQRGLSQEMLAAKLKVDVSTVQNWESGRNFMHDYMCKRIISVLKLTEDEIALLFIIEEKKNKSFSGKTEITEKTFDGDNTSLSESESPTAESPDEVSISEEPYDEAALAKTESETAISEVPTEEVAEETIISESVPNAKPLIAIFKEKWLKIRKPFVVGVGVWAILCVAIAICFIAIHNDNERIIDNISKQIKIAITNPWALIICATILFIVIVGFSVLIYFIIRKIRKK